MAGKQPADETFAGEGSLGVESYLPKGVDRKRRFSDGDSEITRVKMTHAWVSVQ